MRHLALKLLSVCLFGSLLQAPTLRAESLDPAHPLWMRAPAISPDGRAIAFTYRGRIYTVDAGGGEARPLTDAQFRSTDPVWSPDGKTLAFSSAVFNVGDVYALSLEGGDIRRLTYNERLDIPLAFTPDGKDIITSSAGIGAMDVNFFDPTKEFAPGNLHSVPVKGGRERLAMPIPAPQASVSPDGNSIAYTFVRSYELIYRKRQISDGTSDIWIFDRKTGKHRQLTHHRSNEKSPVFSPDGRFIYFTAEMPEGGETDVNAKPVSTNIWRMAADGKSAPEQVTFHDTLPVRGLSISRDNTISYSYDGEIWTVASGDKSEKVAIRIPQWDLARGRVPYTANDQVSEVAVSPDGSELALVARGDIYAVKAATGETRRITDTPQAERSVSFSPDGRTLLYASDREVDWDLYESTITRKEDTGFVGAAEITETRLLNTDSDLLQPKFSPKGDKVAYRDGRNALKVLDIASGKITEALPDSASYSYSEGDLSHAWSPDGRFLTTMTGLTVGNSEVEVIEVATGKRHNISLNGFSDSGANFSRDGSMVYWASDRFSTRQLDDQASTTDYVGAFLSREAARAFTAKEPLKIGPDDLDGMPDRPLRLTGSTQRVLFADLSADNGTLNIVVAVDRAGLVGYAVDVRSGAARQLFQHADTGTEQFAVDGAGKTLYVTGKDQVDAYDLASGKATAIPFDTTAAHDFSAEAAYIFEHQWQFVHSKFYDKNMHGVDWKKMHDLYAKHVSHISHWEDFAELMGELQGELNSSHMFSTFHPAEARWDVVGSLGLYYDMGHEGPGVRIAGVLKGGPADEPGSLLVPGATITSVNGMTIGPDADIAPLLNHTVGKSVLLAVAPSGKQETAEEKIVPIDAKAEGVLAYNRWVSQRRAMVGKLSGGRLGYVHVAGMNDPEMHKVYGELMGRYGKAEGAVIDVRFNVGGFLHDQLITFLTGNRHSGMFTRNGADLGLTPLDRWARPTALVQNAYSYSDGSIFPAYYKREKVGPMVGDRVPGTGTAVFEAPQMEPRLSLAVAQLGFRTKEGQFFENTDIAPDILVPTTPNFVMEARDPQLEAAVVALLKSIDGK